MALDRIKTDTGRAFASAQAAFPGWAATPVERRATALDRAADLIEAGRGRLIALLQIEGALSLVFLANDRLIVARDPHGFRPLTLGKLNDGKFGLDRDSVAWTEGYIERQRARLAGEAGPLCRSLREASQNSYFWSRLSGLDRRPTVYKTVALPLSYLGMTPIIDFPVYPAKRDSTTELSRHYTYFTNFHESKLSGKNTGIKKSKK